MAMEPPSTNIAESPQFRTDGNSPCVVQGKAPGRSQQPLIRNHPSQSGPDQGSHTDHPLPRFTAQGADNPFVINAVMTHCLILTITTNGHGDIPPYVATSLAAEFDV